MQDFTLCRLNKTQSELIENYLHAQNSILSEFRDNPNWVYRTPSMTTTVANVYASGKRAKAAMQKLVDAGLFAQVNEFSFTGTWKLNKYLRQNYYWRTLDKYSTLRNSAENKEGAA